MNSMGSRRIGLLITAVLLLVSACPAGEAKREGRTVVVPCPLGRVAIYLPVGHDVARKWPLVVLLPAYQQPHDQWIKPWKKLADSTGFLLAVPIPSKPNVSTGYPDIVPVMIARSAIRAGGADPDRISIVGHRSAGLGLSATVFSYPRLARTVVIIGSIPTPITARADLAPAMPSFLYLCANKRVHQTIDKYRKANSNLKITVAKLDRAEGPFEASFVGPAVAWIAKQVSLGSQPADPVDAPKPDPAAAGALVDQAETLRARGAGAGAYISLLRATRIDPASFGARMSLARLSLEGRRLNEALEWCDKALRLKPRHAEPRLCAARALLKLGRSRDALHQLAGAGETGKAIATRVRARLKSTGALNRRAALADYRRATGHMRKGEFKEAAGAARAVIKAEPYEAAYRAMAVYALASAEGIAPAGEALNDYLEVLPADPHITTLANLVTASAKVRLNMERPNAKVSLLMGTVLPAGPAPGFLGAMAAKVGIAQDPEELATKLSEGGAGRVLGKSWPVLAKSGIPFSIGNGTMADLRIKLDAGLPVLVQMPPGELAGLRRTEKYNVGMPRLVVGYSDVTHCMLVLDYGAARPLRIPYALFDHLWSSLDRWWMAIPRAKRRLPGLSGKLTEIELASAFAEGGDLRSARVKYERELKKSPRRARLGLGIVLAGLNDLPGARKMLAGIPGGDPDFDVQVAFALGRIELSEPVGSVKERSEKALPHFRKAWKIDPGSQRSTIQLCAALLTRRSKNDLREAREMLEDFLRYRPLSVPCLRLRYAR